MHYLQCAFATSHSFIEENSKKVMTSVYSMSQLKKKIKQVEMLCREKRLFSATTIRTLISQQCFIFCFGSCIEHLEPLLVLYILYLLPHWGNFLSFFVLQTYKEMRGSEEKNSNFDHCPGNRCFHWKIIFLLLFWWQQYNFLFPQEKGGINVLNPHTIKNKNKKFVNNGSYGLQ